MRRHHTKRNILFLLKEKMLFSEHQLQIRDHFLQKTHITTHAEREILGTHIN